MYIKNNINHTKHPASMNSSVESQLKMVIEGMISKLENGENKLNWNMISDRHIITDEMLNDWVKSLQERGIDTSEPVKIDACPMEFFEDIDEVEDDEELIQKEASI